VEIPPERVFIGVAGTPRVGVFPAFPAAREVSCSAGMEPLTVYFAGALFDHKDLLGNAALAERIYALSAGRYASVIPQNLEQRDTSPRAIRDQDLRTLLTCDLALFGFDGDELDSGTVVEFTFAKMADIPSVVLRTDFRGWMGDQKGAFPWNLMCSYYPRTEVVTTDPLRPYKAITDPLGNQHPEQLLQSGAATRAAMAAVEEAAAAVVAALDRVVALPPVLPAAQAEAVFDWLARMPEFATGYETEAARLATALARKRARGLAAT